MGVASPPTKPRSVYDVLRDVKKSVVFLGKPGPTGPAVLATGFIIDVGSITHLVTARHVIVNREGKRLDDDLTVYFNRKKGGVGSRSIDEIRRPLGIDWVMTKDETSDVALIPFGLNQAEDDVLRIPPEIWKPVGQLLETTDLFFLAYQPGTLPAQNVAPVIRAGMVSRLNDDRTFYMDGPAFPGNSGSPVFIRPSPARFLESGTALGQDPLAFGFVGLVGEYVTYQDVAISPQTGRTRVLFEENTGITRVWSTDHMRQLIDSKSFKDQKDGLRASGHIP